VEAHCEAMEWIPEHDIDGVFYLYCIYERISIMIYHSVFNLYTTTQVCICMMHLTHWHLIIWRARILEDGVSKHTKSYLHRKPYINLSSSYSQ